MSLVSIPFKIKVNSGGLEKSDLRNIFSSVHDKMPSLDLGLLPVDLVAKDAVKVQLVLNINWEASDKLQFTFNLYYGSLAIPITMERPNLSVINTFGHFPLIIEKADMDLVNHFSIDSSDDLTTLNMYIHLLALSYFEGLF